jgi:hypothetical protein
MSAVRGRGGTPTPSRRLREWGLVAANSPSRTPAGIYGAHARAREGYDRVEGTPSCASMVVGPGRGDRTPSFTCLREHRVEERVDAVVPEIGA